MKKTTLLSITFYAVIALLLSCGGKGGDAPPPNPCANKTITIAATSTPTSMPASANGTIAASASGSANFTYSLNGGAFQASGNFTGLAVGAYTIVAKDADGCTGTTMASVTATPCPAITVTTVNVDATSSTANNGSITVTAGGSTNFTYSKDNGTTFQASNVFSNLAPGSYTVVAKDGNGCTGARAVTISTAACPAITVTATLVRPTGPTVANGSITVTATGGAMPFTYSRDNGATFQASNVFNNVAAGSYTIVAKDANGCPGNTIVALTANCPTITFTTSITNADKCLNSDGSITVTAAGSSGYTYSRDGVTFQASNIFTNLANTNFNITVRDANNCNSAVTNVTVGQKPAGPTFTAVKALLAANCVGCHSWASDDCQIVSKRNTIKNRVVDGNPSFMPQGGPLPQSERDKVTAWLTAGGKHSD
jgi:large repetitive protein